MEFVHAYDNFSIPIEVKIEIYETNPADKNALPKKTILTVVMEKTKAEEKFQKATKKKLAAGKMSKMANGFGQDYLKFNVNLVFIYYAIIMNFRLPT